MTRKLQRGYVFKAGRSWFVRYREPVIRDGALISVQICKKLGEAPLSRSDARRLADEMLEPLNSSSFTPSSNSSIAEFVKSSYLPYIKDQQRASTYKGYRHIWENHLEPRVGKARLRDFRTYDGERLLSDIAKAQPELTRTSLKRIKSSLSAIFSYAKRVGALNAINPVQGVVLPRGRESEETYAYSLDEILRILAILPAPADMVIAVFAFTGVRKAELRGLEWPDYDGRLLHIRRSRWQSIINPPKTRKSRAPVPVIEPLRKILDASRESSGRIFAFDLDSLTSNVIRPALLASHIAWHGYHAFRRGLATNLRQLGVDHKIIQAILRHEDVLTTMNVYEKVVAPEAVAAMQALERELEKKRACLKEV